MWCWLHLGHQRAITHCGVWVKCVVWARTGQKYVFMEQLDPAHLFLSFYSYCCFAANALLHFHLNILFKSPHLSNPGIFVYLQRLLLGTGTSIMLNLTQKIDWPVQCRSITWLNRLCGFLQNPPNALFILSAQLHFRIIYQYIWFKLFFAFNFKNSGQCRTRLAWVVIYERSGALSWAIVKVLCDSLTPLFISQYFEWKGF